MQTKQENQENTESQTPKEKKALIKSEIEEGRD